MRQNPKMAGQSTPRKVGFFEFLAGLIRFLSSCRGMKPTSP